MADCVVYNCDSILLFEERHLLQRRRVSYYILLQFRNSIIDGIDGNLIFRQECPVRWRLVFPT